MISRNRTQRVAAITAESAIQSPLRKERFEILIGG